MTKPHDSPSREHEDGLTLVEMMIGVLLFAVLSAGSLVVLSGQQQGMLAQQRATNTLDSARATLDALTRQLRVAKAGMPDGRVVVNANHGSIPATATQCGAGVIAVVEVVNSDSAPDQLRVLVPDGTSWGTLSAAVGPTDIQVRVRTDDANAVTVDPQQYMLLSGFDEAVLFQPQTTASLCSTGTGEFCLAKLAGSWTGMSGSIAAGGVLLRSRWLEYSISTTTLGTSTYPSLLVTRYEPGTGSTSEPAALGIEDFQVALGIDGVRTGVADGQLEAENDGGANLDEWVFNAPGETITSSGMLADVCQLQDLRAVRVSIVARGSGEGGRNVAGGRPALEDRPAGASDDVYRVVLRSVVALR